MRFHGIVLALFYLAGCSPSQDELDHLREQNMRLENQVRQLQKSNLEAQERIKNDYVKRMADFSQAEHLAGIAQGCRAVLNVCPNSITGPGDAAIAAGASGGEASSFWTILTIKFGVLLCALLLSLSVWTYRLRPDLQAQKLAEQALDEARLELEQTQEFEASTHRDHQGLMRELANAETLLDEYRPKIEEARIEFNELEQAIKQKKHSLAALGSFKLSPPKRSD
jgi:septal ring factor EnvC (AmiA/AmiB activator)